MTTTQRGDHLASSPLMVQGTLALDFTLSSGVPAVPRPPALTLVGDGEDPDLQGIPSPQLWAGRFVQAVVEVVAGDRPLQQLIRWTDERVYDDLSRRVRLLGLTRSTAVRVRTERSHVRSIHVCRPAATVAEVAAHVRHGGRSRAVAARLEANRGRWLCTALQLG
ncbi:MAG: Rv3235 family protein [Actinomycetota bacterium]|nr:Rv3235 family protein [Actinomycetota bacterium]